MKNRTLLFAQLICLLATAAVAQPVPKVELRPVFAKLPTDRPVWMSEAPDGSGRFFVVGQAGENSRREKKVRTAATRRSF